MGDGTRVKFWDDVWCRDRPFKEVFLDLYNISRGQGMLRSLRLCALQMGEFLRTFSFIV